MKCRRAARPNWRKCTPRAMADTECRERTKMLQHRLGGIRRRRTQPSYLPSLRWGRSARNSIGMRRFKLKPRSGPSIYQLIGALALDLIARAKQEPVETTVADQGVDQAVVENRRAVER